MVPNCTILHAMIASIMKKMKNNGNEFTKSIGHLSLFTPAFSPRVRYSRAFQRWSTPRYDRGASVCFAAAVVRSACLPPWPHDPAPLHRGLLQAGIPPFPASLPPVRAVTSSARETSEVDTSTHTGRDRTELNTLASNTATNIQQHRRHRTA